MRPCAGTDRDEALATAFGAELARLPGTAGVNAVRMAAPGSVAVVIVTYASECVLGSCLGALAAQTRRPDLVAIVDNDSPDSAYLAGISRILDVELIRNTDNLGFSTANNIGYGLARARGYDYVVFLNPDAFPQADLIERAIDWMEKPENAGVGIVTGTLLGYDIAHKRATGAIDSTGIFQRWYGQWYDRDQGLPWTAEGRPAFEDVPAVCGALMFCRGRALENARLPGGDVFDARFFMYKEDIDLSLRLRRHGWRLAYVPALLCFHCRGWQGRSRMSAHARYLSARNELRVCLRNKGKGIAYSLMKFLFVTAEVAWIRLSRP